MGASSLGGLESSGIIEQEEGLGMGGDDPPEGNPLVLTSLRMRFSSRNATGADGEGLEEAIHLIRRDIFVDDLSKRTYS